MNRSAHLLSKDISASIDRQSNSSYVSGVLTGLVFSSLSLIVLGYFGARSAAAFVGLNVDIWLVPAQVSPESTVNFDNIVVVVFSVGIVVVLGLALLKSNKTKFVHAVTFTMIAMYLGIMFWALIQFPGHFELDDYASVGLVIVKNAGHSTATLTILVLLVSNLFFVRRQKTIQEYSYSNATVIAVVITAVYVFLSGLSLNLLLAIQYGAVLGWDLTIVGVDQSNAAPFLQYLALVAVILLISVMFLPKLLLTKPPQSAIVAACISFGLLAILIGWAWASGSSFSEINVLIFGESVDPSLKISYFEKIFYAAGSDPMTQILAGTLLILAVFAIIRRLRSTR